MTLSHNNNPVPFFQSVVAALSGRVCILNQAFEVIAFNKAFEETIYRTAGVRVVLNKTLYDRMEGEDAKYWAEIFNQVLKGKSFEKHLEYIGGVYTEHGMLYMEPLTDEQGRPAILVEVKDLTKEYSYQLSLDAFRLLAENLPNADVFLCDHKMNILIAGGGEMKKYNTVSSHFEGRNMFDMADEYGLGFLKDLYRDAENGIQSKIEYEYEKDHYKVEVFPLMENKQVKNIILFSSNITELKSNNLKLQQINDTKDSILNIVAHDLRNPIMGILGTAELIRQNPEKLGDRLKMIETSGHFALSIISDLLDISELGKENYVLETQVVYLNEFISNIISANQVLADSKEISLVIEAQIPCYARINEDKFSRVLNNLLTNAIKFSHPRQKVTVSVELIRDKVHIKVKDEGIGIPAAMKEYIFDKFTRAGRTGTAGEKSIGLGMSIVKQIVLLHKGVIWIDSEEGKGTTMNIELDAEA